MRAAAAVEGVEEGAEGRDAGGDDGEGELEPRVEFSVGRTQRRVEKQGGWIREGVHERGPECDWYCRV